MTIKHHPSSHPYPLSRAVRAGDLLFLSGQIPMGPDGNPVRADISTQTRTVLDQITLTLTECGVSLNDVVRVTVWLSDLALFAAFNEVYKEYFTGNFPARSTVAAKLVFDVDVEIEVTAYCGSTGTA